MPTVDHTSGNKNSHSYYMGRIRRVSTLRMYSLESMDGVGAVTPASARPDHLKKRLYNRQL